MYSPTARVDHAALSTPNEPIEELMDIVQQIKKDHRNVERLFRDARCGRFHPANSMLVHEIVAKTALGIDLGVQRSNAYACTIGADARPSYWGI